MGETNTIEIQLNKDTLRTDNPCLSILDLALKHKVDLNHSCGGYGTCGTCRVIVKNHELLPARNDIETEMAQDRGFAPEERLACQNKVVSKLIVKTP